MATRHVGVLVVGAGQAGAGLAWALRDVGYDGTIAILGEEERPPYERPPLSKDVLSGDMDARRLSLRTAESYVSRDVGLVCGVRVAALDPTGHRAVTADGDEWTYDHCVLATGAVPRVPTPVAEAGGHVVRTVEDAVTLAGRARAGQDVVVLGGGFLGLEIAASLRKRGARTTVVEQANQIMPGRVSPHTAQAFHRLHTDNGVVIRFGETAESVQESSAGSGVLVTRSGAELSFDHLVVAAGAQPCSQIARDAGIACGSGVLVDDEWRTSAPDVFAVGDVASRRAPDGSEVRIESVSNATTSAKAAAHVIAGRPLPPVKVPTFWSTQHGVRLQTAGFVAPAIGVEDVVDDHGPTSYVVRRHQEGRLVGLEVVGRPADFVRGVAELTRAVRESPVAIT
ncbi:MAG TPA: FAD-dependent oxidoreductase [Actinomycetales bacterium]|nr:FAD-dependent oxidoreductase [Actinomycetales bacterium]